MTNIAQSNLRGGAFLLLDMSLNIWALTIVKALGLGYPVAQLVFLRASVGAVIMLPWAVRHWSDLVRLDQRGLQLLRVGLACCALSTNYFAIARLPFALFSSIGFTRPIVMMALAAVFLHEAVPAKRWVAAGVAFVGVLIAVEPSQLVGGWGLVAMLGNVVFGSVAIIVTRKLNAAPMGVMMTVFTFGVTAFSAPFAFAMWETVAAAHWLPLLAVGGFAQCAQVCFLAAHRRAEAGFLAVLAYLSLVLTTTIGYLVFDEIPNVHFAIGAALIVGATLWITFGDARKRRFAVR